MHKEKYDPENVRRYIVFIGGKLHAEKTFPSVNTIWSAKNHYRHVATNYGITEATKYFVHKELCPLIDKVSALCEDPYLGKTLEGMNKAHVFLTKYERNGRSLFNYIKLDYYLAGRGQMFRTNASPFIVNDVV